MKIDNHIRTKIRITRNVKKHFKLYNIEFMFRYYIYLNCILMKRDIKVCMRSKNGIAVKVCTKFETIR